MVTYSLGQLGSWQGPWRSQNLSGQAREAGLLSANTLPFLTEGCPWEPELSCTLGLCLLDKAVVENKKATGFKVASWSLAAATEESEWGQGYQVGTTPSAVGADA